jgi:quercetin dioxygenase-like cupin family protein
MTKQSCTKGNCLICYQIDPMELKSFPFQTVNWNDIEAEEHKGISGTATWKIFRMGDIRVRQVTYSAGYIADHWCKKGHIIYCIAGSMTTKLEDGREYLLSAGMSYHIGDNNEAHQSSTVEGCTLFIVD